MPGNHPQRYEFDHLLMPSFILIHVLGINPQSHREKDEPAFYSHGDLGNDPRPLGNEEFDIRFPYGGIRVSPLLVWKRRTHLKPITYTIFELPWRYRGITPARPSIPTATLGITPTRWETKIIALKFDFDFDSNCGVRVSPLVAWRRGTHSKPNADEILNLSRRC